MEEKTGEAASERLSSVYSLVTSVMCICGCQWVPVGRSMLDASLVQGSTCVVYLRVDAHLIFRCQSSNVTPPQEGVWNGGVRRPPRHAAVAVLRRRAQDEPPPEHASWCGRVFSRMVEEPMALHSLIGPQSVEGDMCPSPRMRLGTTYPDERGCEGRAPVSWGGGQGYRHAALCCLL